jgi:hypothetical protein
LNPEEEALGRSKGGFSTKVHLACDGKGRPLSVLITPGQRHGSSQLEELLDAVRVPRPRGTLGRPRKRPAHLLADRGYEERDPSHRLPLPSAYRIDMIAIIERDRSISLPPSQRTLCGPNRAPRPRSRR